MSHLDNPLYPIIDKFFALKEKEDYGQALSYIRESIALYPKNGLLHTLYGELLADLGQYDEAIVQCRSAVECNPKIPAYYVMLGRVLFIAYTRSPEPHSIITTTLNEVLGALYKALEKSPGNIDTRIMLSGTLQKAGEFDKSIAVARKILEDEPDSGLALYYLGSSLYDLGYLDEAERTLIRAEEVLPEESGIVYMLAKVVEAKGDLVRAQDIFCRYKLLNPLALLSSEVI